MQNQSTPFSPLLLLPDTWHRFFYQSLIGIEKVDVNENSTWKDYIKSKLFLVPTLLIIQGIIFVASIILGIIILPLSIKAQEPLVITVVTPGIFTETGKIILEKEP